MKDKELTDKVIAGAINVHRALGPGFLESAYEEAMCVEMESLDIAYERQKPVNLQYKDRIIGEYRLDLLVENAVVLELKAIKDLDPIHFSVVRSYMKAVEAETGLLLNFNAMPLMIKRVGREREFSKLS